MGKAEKQRRSDEDLEVRMRPVSEWLQELTGYQSCYGFGEVPPRSNEDYGPVGQWVQRMRRFAGHGKLSIAVVSALVSSGADLQSNEEKRHSATAQEQQSFERNLRSLKAWMSGAADEKGISNLSYLGSREPASVRKIYTFLEHMRLKCRQGLLSDKHLDELLALPLLMNGIALSDWLTEPTSLRDIDKMIAANNENLMTLHYWRPLTSQRSLYAYFAQTSRRERMLYVPSQGFIKVVQITQPVFGRIACEMADGRIEMFDRAFIRDDGYGAGPIVRLERAGKWPEVLLLTGKLLPRQSARARPQRTQCDARSLSLT